MKKLPECWYAASGIECNRLTDELVVELIQGHQLFNVSLNVIGHRDGANDDILCKHKDAENLYSVVHLTWSMKPEIDGRYPSVDFHGTYNEFLEWERLQF